MSLLQQLGAQLRATSEELPTGQVSVAMQRLHSATELLNWVRQTSIDRRFHIRPFRRRQRGVEVGGLGNHRRSGFLGDKE